MMRGLRALHWSTTMERRKITRAQKTCSYSRLQECQGSLTPRLLLLLLTMRAALSYCSRSLEDRRRHRGLQSNIRPGEAECRPPMRPSNATEIPTA
ncbi:hypothetical protein ALC60_01269 [Trachymyrmex zeteki]|uniref:Uncharacterized protein n=1 Tax=Mycetomoellerius zeteki TaxID=64791 RepID=A0A151XGS5_9HYME|nr:hypothetical protein ALC60_01269 [Trachymyrmex zeteki]